MQKTQALASLDAFLTDDSEIRTIIEWCRLIPKNSWKLWTDRMGFILSVQKNKKTSVLSENDSFIVPDLYFKSPPRTIASKTKTALILYSIENECCCFFLLGHDGRLRILYYHRGWKPNAPPLSYGMSNLRTVVKAMVSDKIPDCKNIVLPNNIKPTDVVLGPWPAILETATQNLSLTNSPLVAILSELV